MKKQIITLAILLSLCSVAWAQKEYKVARSTGKLILNLPGAVIEGYDGNEIIFSSRSAQEEEDPRAKGLQALSSSGLKDNTGLGISVMESEEGVQVNPVGNTGRYDVLTIRVPQQLSVAFTNDNTMFADTVKIKNMKGEIEVSSTSNMISLVGNSGPMNIKTVRGSVDAAFESDIKGPVSIVSVYGHVDVSLPTATKANVSLGTFYGKLYAADAFNLVIKPTTKADTIEEIPKAANTIAISRAGNVNSSVNRVVERPIPPALLGALESVTVTGFTYHGGEPENLEGTMNGGGINLILKSTHKNVYLRTN
ncbi:hypothetical protein [Parapedobacter sp. DT-150]|uniref:hypothetical protein n=1 Tax=Parapedobacter sp. DT-150 TaxID=3396162 RepID=UPI003F1D8E29